MAKQQEKTTEPTTTQKTYAKAHALMRALEEMVREFEEAEQMEVYTVSVGSRKYSKPGQRLECTLRPFTQE